MQTAAQESDFPGFVSLYSAAQELRSQCNHVMVLGDTDLVIIHVILVSGSWRLPAGFQRERWEICGRVGAHEGRSYGSLRVKLHCGLQNAGHSSLDLVFCAM